MKILSECFIKYGTVVCLYFKTLNTANQQDFFRMVYEGAVYVMCILSILPVIGLLVYFLVILIRFVQLQIIKLQDNLKSSL